MPDCCNSAMTAARTSAGRLCFQPHAVRQIRRPKYRGLVMQVCTSPSGIWRSALQSPKWQRVGPTIMRPPKKITGELVPLHRRVNLCNSPGICSKHAQGAFRNPGRFSVGPSFRHQRVQVGSSFTGCGFPCRACRGGGQHRGVTKYSYPRAFLRALDVAQAQVATFSTAAAACGSSGSA